MVWLMEPLVAVTVKLTGVCSTPQPGKMIPPAAIKMTARRNLRPRIDFNLLVNGRHIAKHARMGQFWRWFIGGRFIPATLGVSVIVVDVVPPFGVTLDGVKTGVP
jgi:hypothetical protein